MILCDMVDRHVFALAAGHGQRVARLQGFGLGLRGDVIQVRYMLVVVTGVFLVGGLSRNGPPGGQSYDCKSGEAYGANKVGFL